MNVYLIPYDCNLCNKKLQSTYSALLCPAMLTGRSFLASNVAVKWSRRHCYQFVVKNLEILANRIVTETDKLNEERPARNNISLNNAIASDLKNEFQ